MKANAFYVLQRTDNKEFFYCTRYWSNKHFWRPDIIQAKKWKMKSAAETKKGELTGLEFSTNYIPLQIVEYQLLPKVARSRPSWDDYFMGLAFVVSQRSHDKHTAHGCVIVDQDHHILGCGYNGFPRGFNDDSLPTLLERPEKYNWMVHSEVNAVTNMMKQGKGPFTAYVTGECCNDCLIHMWQNHITEVVQAERLGSVLLDEESRKRKEILLQQTNYSAENLPLKIRTIQVNNTWLLPCVI